MDMDQSKTLAETESAERLLSIYSRCGLMLWLEPDAKFCSQGWADDYIDLA